MHDMYTMNNILYVLPLLIRGCVQQNILQNGTFAVSQTSVGLEMDGIQIEQAH